MSEQEREERCKNCKYFFVIDNKLAGDCRRRSPETPVHKFGAAVWPQVEKNEWCGEFKPKD